MGETQVFGARLGSAASAFSVVLPVSEFTRVLSCHVVAAFDGRDAHLTQLYTAVLCLGACEDQAGALLKRYTSVGWARSINLTKSKFSK